MNVVFTLFLKLLKQTTYHSGCKVLKKLKLDYIQKHTPLTANRKKCVFADNLSRFNASSFQAPPGQGHVNVVVPLFLKLF